MDSQDFVQLRRQAPFRPFRVRTKEGRTFDAVHQDLLMPCSDYVIISFPRNGSDKAIFETFMRVRYADIDQLEMLDADKAQQNK